MQGRTARGDAKSAPADNMAKQQIYLDNAATTKTDSKVITAMIPYLSEKYGNASSQHEFGKEAKLGLEESRKIIAESIGAMPEELIFTSGGTESNNLAIKGLAEANPGKKHIITSKIEHDSILQVLKYLEAKGYRITYLNVDKKGFVNPLDVKKAISKDTLLVTLIHANNEIGTIQDIGEIGRICREKGVYFHTDACQSYTKSDINIKVQCLDLVTLNAHKIHGPKGIGALYIRKGISINTIQHGGGHEKNLRSGTENIPAIVGFAEASKISGKADIAKISKLRDYLIKEILKIKDTKLNGPTGDKRLCNNINVSFANIEGEAISSYLDSFGICISTGSACASHNLEKSHVLKAIGASDLEINSSIRVSLSKYINLGDINYFIKTLKEIVNKLRKLSPLIK
jgi:cysteine desulfurase